MEFIIVAILMWVAFRGLRPRTRVERIYVIEERRGVIRRKPKIWVEY